MAKVENLDYSKKHGKMNRKDNVIHRVRNGKEHVYSIKSPYTGPASKAQKAHRSLFGKINSIVNTIMLDPAQEAEWTARRDAYHDHIASLTGVRPRQTTRQFVFASIREQLEQADERLAKPRSSSALPKDVRLQIKPFAELSASELYEILKARMTVFMIEQGIHYLDEDNIDYLSTHYFLTQSGRVVAYARVYPDAEPGVLRIGRMLTIERGKGYARYLMRRITTEARKKGAACLRLHAQKQAAPFYRKCRFHTVGKAFLEAGIPHLCMEKGL